MKYKEIREGFESYSSSVSKITRQLTLAGLAGIWMMSAIEYNSLDVPSKFRIPLSLFAASIVLDLAQQIYQSLHYYLLYFKDLKKYKETTNATNGEFEELEADEDESPAILGWLIWGIKILLMFAGYIFLAIELEI